MAKRQREWARRKREEIFDRLGRVCAKCGSKEELEFDLKVPSGSIDISGKEKHHRAMEWSWRMSFYRRELEKGNLQVLCTHCNTKKLNQMELTSESEVEQPF